MDSFVLFLLLALTVVLVMGLLGWYAADQLTHSVDWLQAQNRVDDLLAILDSPARAGQHRAALLALGKLADLRALAPVTEALDRYPVEASEALAHFGPLAVRPLVQRLRQSGSPQAAAALVALGPVAASDLAELLSDPAPGVRRAAARTLERLGWPPTPDARGAAYWIALEQPARCAALGPAALPALLDSLPHTALRADTLAALGTIPDGRVLQPLLEATQDPATSEAALHALANLTRLNQTLVLPGLKHPERALRRTTAAVLDANGWKPGLGTASGYYFLAKGQWARCVALGALGVPALEEALHDPAASVRREAAAALGEVRQPEAVSPLLSALDDPDPQVQAQAVRAFGALGQKAAAPPLVRALQQDALRPAALQALAALGPAAHEALFAALIQPDWGLKRAADAALTQLQAPPPTGPALAYRAILHHEWEACRALGPSAVEPLAAALTQPELRMEAAQTLGKIGDPLALDALLDALRREPSRAVQRALVRAMGKLGPQAVEPLLAALRNPALDPTSALLVLGLLGEERAVDPLLRVVLDRSARPSARKAASWSLGRIGLPALGPILDALRLKGLDLRANRLIGLALGQMGRPATPALTAALNDREIDMEAIFLALGQIGDPRALEPLLAALKGKRFGWQMRKTAVWALGNLGPGALPSLIALLGDSGVDEATVCAALGKMGAPAVEPLLAALPGLPPGGQMAAVEVLGALGDGRAIPALKGLLANPRLKPAPIQAALKRLRKGRPTAAPTAGELELEDLDEWGLG